MIRTATEDDALQIQRIYRPAVTEGAVSFETEVPSLEEIRRRIRTTLERYPWLVDEDASHVRGYAYATSLRERAAYGWSVEVSVYVDAGLRRQGCGKSLYERLFELLRQLGYRSAYAGVALPNVTSQTFHESLGFVRIGVFPRVGFKLGEWHDVAWWYRALADDSPLAPPPPVPFAQWQPTGDELG